MFDIQATKSRGISFVALLMVLFGTAEVVTFFTHQFFNISTNAASTFSYLALVVGILYILAGYSCRFVNSARHKVYPTVQ